MLRRDQLEQARKLLHFLESRTTAMAEGIYRNPVSDYTSSEQLARERALFFRRGPFTIGLSCRLPQRGDYLTHDFSGIPMLLVRQPDGSLGAFVNACRHRGARLAEGCGSGARDFSCPYHGWTYALDGRLAARPDERSFAEIERAERGLSALPVVEKYGMIWLSPTSGANFDVDAALGGLERDLAAYRLDTYHHYETRVLRRRINWKIVVDTFLETYHLPVLHTRTVHAILHSNLATFDAFGRNLRMIAARRTIAEMRSLPETEWNLIPHAAIVYVLFPNTVFIMQGDHVETWHVYPLGDRTDECVMEVSLYTPEPATSESARGHWDRNMDLLMATVEKEDFPLSEGMQQGFNAGALEDVLFGRNEPALQHYHRSIKAALAEG
jgi:phenylpropionate dioxygenase-like ring-hydroxylating dioxygenase large terminal subunit